LSLKYVDDDDDEIKFDTDMELQSAIALRDDSGLLRLRGVVCPELQDKYTAMMQAMPATSATVTSVTEAAAAPTPDSQPSELSLESSWVFADAQASANESDEESEEESAPSSRASIAVVATPLVVELEAEDSSPATIDAPVQVEDVVLADDVSEDGMSYVQVPSPVSLSSTEPAVVSFPAAAPLDDEEPRVSMTKAEFTSVLQCKKISICIVSACF
jgi:hypothetical protein